MPEPMVTVLMPVYNGEPFLREAIASILNQTFTDWQLLIINDASNDRSVAVIEASHDPRIRLINNQSHQGLVATLNQGLDLAQTKYIARMDADDISLPERLERQVSFLEANPAVGVCGTWFEYLDTGRVIRRPIWHQICIDFMLTAGCPFAHPTVMLRTVILRQHHFYYEPAYESAEDFELWARMVKVTQFANLPEILLHYRTHPGQMSVRNHQEQQKKTEQIKKSLIRYFVH